MEILSDPTPYMHVMPRFDGGAIDMQELLRRLVEQVVNAMMDAEADQPCGGSNSRNGYLERALATCVGGTVSQVFRRRGHVRAGRDIAGVQVLLVDEGTSSTTRAQVRNRLGGRLGAV